MRAPITAGTLGFCYLLHFSRPLGNLTNARAQAAHYCGFADDPDGDGAGLDRRIAEHLAGRGAKLTRAAVAQGIEISLVAAWRAPLAFEKQLKRRKEAPRLCPLCAKAHGRPPKRVSVPGWAGEQLELPFDTEIDFPDPPPLRPDWLEVRILRQWRAASAQPAALADDWDAGLL